MEIFILRHGDANAPTKKLTDDSKRSLSDVGIDISSQRPKELTDQMMKSSIKIVNMGCMYDGWCPTQYAHVADDWGLEDPKGRPIEKFRQVRNEIEDKVRKLCDSLE